MSQNHKSHRPVLELIHRTEKAVAHFDHCHSQVDLGNTAIGALAGARAFRDYDWLTNAAATNAAGNLRGMVVSAKWRVAFRYSDRIGKHLGNSGLLAAFAAGIGEAEEELGQLANSNDSALIKGARIAAIAGTAALRALGGTVPAGTHLIYKSLQGWCMLAGLAGGKVEFGANQCVGTLQLADTLVQSTFKTMTDTQNQSKAVWWVVDTVLSPRSRK
jgi:hypothetical protein